MKVLITKYAYFCMETCLFSHQNQPTFISKASRLQCVSHIRIDCSINYINKLYQTISFVSSRSCSATMATSSRFGLTVPTVVMVGMAVLRRSEPLTARTTMSSTSSIRLLTACNRRLSSLAMAVLVVVGSATRKDLLARPAGL